MFFIEASEVLCTNMNEMLIKWWFDTVVVDNFENIAVYIVYFIAITNKYMKISM